MKFIKTFGIIVVVIVLFASLTGMASPISREAEVTNYDPNVNYMALMIKCAEDGSDYAMALGAKYEQFRNFKIQTLNLSYETTNYFIAENDGQTVLDLIKGVDKKSEQAIEVVPAMRSLGIHRVTGYTNDYQTASGSGTYIGCCAVNGLPFGTKVYVDGLGYYTVEDRGGMSDAYAVDIYCSSVAECYAITGYYEIFIVG